jgi:hypothetical protein
MTEFPTHEDVGQENKEEALYRQPLLPDVSHTFLENAETFWLDHMELGLVEQWRDRRRSPDELAAEMNEVAARLLEVALRLTAGLDDDEKKADMSEPPPSDEHDNDLRRLALPLGEHRLGDIAWLAQASFKHVIGPFLAEGQPTPTEQHYFALALARCFLDEAEDILSKGYELHAQTGRTLALTLQRMLIRQPSTQPAATDREMLRRELISEPGERGFGRRKPPPAAVR